jgi:hypothetical protein
MKQRYKRFFETRYSLRDFKKGQIVKINPDAEVNFSYKEGEVPKKYLENYTWLIDDIEYASGMLNIHSLDPVPEEGEIGGACSSVHYKDIIEIIK